MMKCHIIRSLQLIAFWNSYFGLLYVIYSLSTTQRPQRKINLLNSTIQKVESELEPQNLYVLFSLKALMETIA